MRRSEEYGVSSSITYIKYTVYVGNFSLFNYSWLKGTLSLSTASGRIVSVMFMKIKM